MADPVGALVTILKADLNLTRVFGGELPAHEAASMRSDTIVIRPSGGISLTGDSNVEHDTQRVDLFGYGATPRDAMALVERAGLALRRVERRVAADTLVHWVNSAGGYSSGREPDTDWPRVFQSFQIFYALESIPAPDP